MAKNHPQGFEKAFGTDPRGTGSFRAGCLHRALARLTALTLLSTAALSAAATTAIATTNAIAAHASGAAIAAQANGAADAAIAAQANGTAHAASAAEIAASADAAGTRTERLARAFFDADASVAPAELDTMRGGLHIGGGLLQVSFGIERTVSLNGEVVSHTAMLLRSARGPDEAANAAARAALSDIKLIQNGSGNVMQTSPGAYTAGSLVIQNSLNNQHIQSQTVITASVNSMDMLKALNFQGSLSDALAHAVPAR